MEHWTPDTAWCEKHKAEINEAETWVELQIETRPGAVKTLHFRKDSGLIVLCKGFHHEVFRGYVPSEEALEQVIGYTRW